METDFTSKNIKKFWCEKCDFKCSKMGDYSRHLTTDKHKRKQMETNGNKITSHHLSCECGKVYKNRTGLWKHKQVCKNPKKHQTLIDDNHSKDNPTIEMLKAVIKDNRESMLSMMQTMVISNREMVENLVPKLQPNITNNTQNNNLNINIFLNEKCKDAMNLTDFIESLPVTPQILNDTRENGLTKSLTNMMVDGLNTLDIYKRPIHCTDPKRKIMYVKENDVWEKDEEQSKIKQGVSMLAVKQRANINNWQDGNDDWEKDENMQVKFTNLVGQALQLSDQEPKEQNKILKGICNATYINEKMKSEDL
jgi:hypothetical protein